MKKRYEYMLAYEDMTGDVSPDSDDLEFVGMSAVGYSYEHREYEFKSNESKNGVWILWRREKQATSTVEALSVTDEQARSI